MDLICWTASDATRTFDMLFCDLRLVGLNFIWIVYLLLYDMIAYFIGDLPIFLGFIAVVLGKNVYGLVIWVEI
jgi:hypothetical protein